MVCARQTEIFEVFGVGCFGNIFFGLTKRQKSSAANHGAYLNQLGGAKFWRRRSAAFFDCSWNQSDANFIKLNFEPGRKPGC
jgi:hypothetical protein